MRKEYFVKRLPSAAMNTIDYNEEMLATDESTFSLFLCTKDIQEGDIVHDGLGGSVHLDNINDKLDIDFKIIGTISPDAIWVKEGMEFSEDEIEPYIYDPNEEGWIADYYGNDVNEMLESGFKVAVNIKCPTCGHFH